MIEIKRWTDGKVIYTAEHAADVRVAVEQAVSESADLSYADLSYADLSYADLRYADLRYADLSSARLSYADLRYADLRSARLSSARLSSADLRSADLSSADLSSARLSSADLRSADLSSADLSSARLSSADLRSARLSSADLRSARLSSARLSSARLSSADLSSADLSSADLSSADLSSADGLPASALLFVRQDLWDILDAAPAEVPALRSALIEGRINGSVYEGACACLVGTIANARGVDYHELDGITADGDRPAEAWFMPIATGDMPTLEQLAGAPSEPVSEGVYRATVAVGWIDEWTESRTRLVAAFNPPAA